MRLQEPAIVRKFRITASDGKQYDTLHHNLDVIISVGYRVKSHHGAPLHLGVKVARSVKEFP